jgi:hypothetical protein
MEKMKIDSGVFSFLANRGLKLCDMRRILSLYALDIHGIKRPRKVKAEWYVIISELAQQDFATFKRIYNKHKERRAPIKTYNDWYDECSIDGTFAYNGVADDF